MLMLADQSVALMQVVRSQTTGRFAKHVKWHRNIDLDNGTGTGTGTNTGLVISRVDGEASPDIMSLHPTKASDAVACPPGVIHTTP